MPEISTSHQAHIGQDAQVQTGTSSKTGSSSRDGSQNASSQKAQKSLEQQKSTGLKTSTSHATRGSTKQTSTKLGSTRVTTQLTPELESRVITKEDATINFSLSIDIKLGNLPERLTLPAAS